MDRLAPIVDRIVTAPWDVVIALIASTLTVMVAAMVVAVRPRT